MPEAGRSFTPETNVPRDRHVTTPAGPGCAGREDLQRVFARIRPDPRLEYSLQGLVDIQIDPVECPRQMRSAGGLCIKSEIGEFSAGRPIFVSANPTKYTTRPASSGSRVDGFSPYGSGSAVDPKTGPRQFEKSSLRWSARLEPGRRPRA